MGMSFSTAAFLGSFSVPVRACMRVCVCVCVWEGGGLTVKGRSC